MESIILWILIIIYILHKSFLTDAIKLKTCFIFPYFTLLTTARTIHDYTLSKEPTTKYYWHIELWLTF